MVKRWTEYFYNPLKLEDGRINNIIEEDVKKTYKLYNKRKSSGMLSNCTRNIKRHGIKKEDWKMGIMIV